MPEYDDNLDYSKVDPDKVKRDKVKNSSRRMRLLVLEGLILLVVVLAGVQLVFRDSPMVMDLQATIDAQNALGTLDADELFARAMTSIEAGDVDVAFHDLDYAIEIEPTFAAAYYERGYLYYEQGNYALASRDFTDAINSGFDDPKAVYYWRGRSYYQADYFNAAIEDFRKVIALDDSDAYAMYWLGRSYMQLGNNETGVVFLKQSLDMGLDLSMPVYFFIASAYDALGDYELSVTYYTLSLDTTEDCVQYDCWIDYNNRGVAYYEMEQYMLAIEDYTQAMKAKPDGYPLAMKNRSNAYEALGEMALALSDRNTMFRLLEGEVVFRKLTEDTRSLQATIEAMDTQVHITFDGIAGDVITVTLTVPDESGLNSVMLLRDPNGDPVAYSADMNSLDAYFTDVLLTTSGTYTIVVASDLGATSGAFELRLDT